MWLKLLFSVVASIVVAIGSMRLVALQHDWGWNAAEIFLGPPNWGGAEFGGVAEFMTSFYMSFVLGAGSGGIAFGYLRKAYSLPKWSRVVPFLVATIGILVITELKAIDDVLNADVLWVLGPATALYFAAQWCAEKLFSALSEKIAPWRVVLPGLLPACPAIFLEGAPFATKVAFDGVSIFVACLAAAWLVRSKQPSTALVSALFCMIPYLVFDAYNLSTCLVADLGERCLLSASLITLWAAVCATAGALAGYGLYRARHRI
jgi:hypothetical protein